MENYKNSTVVNGNAAFAASENVLDVFKRGNRKQCARVFGTWFGEEPSKAAEAIQARLEMLPVWENNLRILQQKLQEDIVRRQKAMNILAHMSDEEIAKLAERN